MIGTRIATSSNGGAARLARGGLLTLAILALHASIAFAARPVDITGTWGVFSGPYTQHSTIVMNKQTGVFSGPGTGTNGTGYTWPDHGKVTGHHVHWVFGPYDQLKSYTATCDGTISASANKIVGQCSDTFHHPVVAGSWVMTRRGGAPKSHKGAKTCRVPKLAGLTLSAARHALARAHCSAGAVARRKSKNVHKGRVIASTPAAGAKRKTGAKVKLILSRGPR